eukprot:5648444-Pyramimonas_sp.AAC.1
MARPQHAPGREATQRGAQIKHDKARAHCARNKGAEQHRQQEGGRGGSGSACKWGGATASQDRTLGAAPAS